MGKSRHFKFRVLIDTEECWCARDMELWMYAGSRDFFKFWEVSDNISEKVQD